MINRMFNFIRGVVRLTFIISLIFFILKLTSNPILSGIIGDDIPKLSEIILDQWISIFYFLFKIIFYPIDRVFTTIDFYISQREVIDKLSDEIIIINESRDYHINHLKEIIESKDDVILNLESVNIDLINEINSINSKVRDIENSIIVKENLIRLECQQDLQKVYNQMGYWQGLSEGQSKSHNNLSKVHWTAHTLVFLYEVWNSFNGGKRSSSFNSQDREVLNTINSTLLRGVSRTVPNSSSGTASMPRGNVT